MTLPATLRDWLARWGVVPGALLINLALALLVMSLVTPRRVEGVAQRVTRFVEFVHLVPASRDRATLERDVLPPLPAAPQRAPSVAPAGAPAQAAASASTSATSAAAASADALPALTLPPDDGLAMLERAMAAAPARAPGAHAGPAAGSGAGGAGAGQGSGEGANLELRADDIEINLAPSYKSAPAYPVRALKEGIEGRVTVEFMIDTQGNVREPRIVHAEPAELFDEAVLRALPKWKFSPKLVNGHAVERRARQDVLFRLHRQ